MVEELGSGRKNIKKYAPYYFSGCQISIANEGKFVFSITYRNVDIIPESEHVNFESEHATAKSEHVNPENEHVNLENEHVNLIPTTAQINSIYTLIDENVTGNINEPVKQSIFKIISYLLNNSGANGNTLAIMLGKRRSSLTRHLKLLRDANIIEFVGS
ncbi:MAG: ArsR family transcriptional regulator, partial [Tannerella sp.]|nr:ArsR family transcriptional regulator [Tannerella sp.]